VYFGGIDNFWRIDNHIDIFFMHFPSMSRNGQVATAGCNGQAFF
jgi:hypothetical protein